MADFLSAFPGHTVWDMDRLVAEGRIKLIGQLLGAKYAKDNVEAQQIGEAQQGNGGKKMRSPRRKTRWHKGMNAHEKAQWAGEMTASNKHNLNAADDALARDYPEMYPERQGRNR